MLRYLSGLWGPRLLFLGLMIAVGWPGAGSYGVVQAQQDPGKPSLAVKKTEPIFADKTAQTGLDFIHWNGMSGQFYFPEVVGSGGALFDFDRDGDLDLFLVQGAMLGNKDPGQSTFPPQGPLPPGDRLYRNDLKQHPDGTTTVHFVDVTAESRIQATHYGMGAAAADYDNDGWTDLYITNFGPNQLWRNLGPNDQGKIRFEEVAEAAAVAEKRWTVPATFFDFDQDGWLDLYLANYMDYSVARNKTCLSESGLQDYCGPQSYQPQADRLLRNLGPGKDGRVRFEDVSTQSGIDQEFGAALGVISADFNGDGRLDIYVANDQTANQLWLNQGTKDGHTRFLNDALLLGCALNQDGQAEASMGIDAADFDGDGDEDLFLTHLSRESNTLYVNDGSGLFRDRSVQSGLGNPSWKYTGFGTGWLDYDNDSLLDLLAVNGSVYWIFELAREGDPYPLRQPNQLFRNEGNRFEEVTARAGPAFQTAEVSRGALLGDLDNDGDTDVVVTNNSGPARVLMNEVGQRNSWIGFLPVEGDPPRVVLSARVAVHRPNQPPLWHRVRTDGSYASSRDPRILVGLGKEKKISKVEVHWPGGAVEHWQNLDLNHYHTLHKGQGSTETQKP